MKNEFNYTLLDTGDGKKLERFGQYRLIRPEPQAMWHPALSEKEWNGADGVFQSGSEEGAGRWKLNRPLPSRWIVKYEDIQFFVAPTAFRHLGIFPEYAMHWDWMREAIGKAAHPISMLNLFGYTGISSLVAARAGAHVTHIDASKKIVAWARENQNISGLDEKPIRWIVDDALAFVRREVKRGKNYDAILIDPPKFGRGPKGEVWKLHESLPVLLDECKKLLSERPLFIILSAYAVRVSAASLGYLLDDMFSGKGGAFETGEIMLVEQSRGRLLAQGAFARWKIL